MKARHRRKFELVEGKMRQLDPQQGQVWEHRDGGSIYVRSRSGPLVKVQRRPFGDSQAIPQWIKLQTFTERTTGLLRPTQAELDAIGKERG